MTLDPVTEATAMAEAQRTTDPCTVPGSEFTPACTNAPPPKALDDCKLPNGNYDIGCYNAYMAQPSMAKAPDPVAADANAGAYVAGGFVLLLILAALYFIPYIVVPRLVGALVDISLRGTKPCPFCAKRIKEQARICPHCQHALTPLELKPP